MFRVQTGAFGSKSNAKRLSARVRNKGIENFIRRDAGLWRVQVGAFEQRDGANEIVKKLKYNGFEAYVKEDRKAHNPPKKKMPRNTWWGVGPKWLTKPFTTTKYRQYLWKGQYPFGCRGNSRHHGLDVGNKRGMPIYAWGRCVIRINGYDNGGYHRYIQVYFPDVNMTLTLGHLLNGSTYPVGTWFNTGDYIAKVGTKADGLTHPHVHYRGARGDWGNTVIYPCGDIHPVIVWNALDPMNA